MSADIYQKIAELISRCERIAVATIVKAEGSTPQGVGAKIIVQEDGSKFGTIGGGCLENAVIEEAQQALKDGKSRLSHFDLTENGVGMICGGSVDVMVEVIQLTSTLLIIGSGNIATPLSKLGQMLGFKVVVIDPFARRENFPEADDVIVEPVDEGLSKVTITPQTYIVIVTRHQYDEPALKSVLHSEAAYIGMVGSLNRVNTIFQRFLHERIAAEEALERIYAPIGLDIGAQTVEEIALSIMAEIIHIRRGGTCKSLRFKIKEAQQEKQ